MKNMCPVCKSDTKIFAKFKNHLVYKCKKCGFGYTTNLSAHLGQYHRDEVYIQEEKLFENIFQKRVNKVMNFKKKGEVLDVGSSTGLMLKLFKDKGFNVLGVEISNKAAALSKNRGIDVITIPFEEIQFKKKFDVILFNHTLEHLKDPFLAINKASRLLNKDGLLYIDLPNFGSLSASLKRKNWPYLLLEEHLWHFSLQSLEILLRKNGLKIIFTERASGIWDLNNPFLELFTSLYKFKKRFIINLLTAIPGLILSKLNMGSDLLVIAKKND